MAKTNPQLIADDPEMWSRILALYGNKPCWRSRIHAHLPSSLRDTPHLLMPLLRKSLTCPGAFADALYVSSLFPELTGEVVRALRQADLRAAVSRDQIVASLACLFGVTFHPKTFFAKSVGEQTRIAARVHAEFSRRFASDLDSMFASETRSFDGGAGASETPRSQPMRQAL